MILPAGLKVHTLVEPAHGPVDLPGQLAAEILGEVEVSLVAAGAAVVGDMSIFVVGKNGGGVLAAVGAIDGHGIVMLPLAGLRLLGAEGIENVENFAALGEGFQYQVHILARAVHLALMAVVHLNAEALHGLFKDMLKVRRVAGKFRAVVKGVGNVHIGAADILLHVAVDLGHVHGDLPQAVILVPAEQEACFLAHLAQRLDHEVAGGHVAEVADVDGARGADAGGADVFFLVRAAPDDLLRDFFRPMHGYHLKK